MLVLAVLGLFAFALAVVYFARNPQAFFFMPQRDEQRESKNSTGLTVLAWVLVVGLPVAWLVLGAEFSAASTPSLGSRFAFAYAAFAWAAATVALYRHLY
jgi:drug/metabolite transporter (DMT)-like permease